MEQDISWIKLSTDLPNNRKIKQIRALPQGDTLALMWVFLLCLAGTTNDNGLIYMARGIPYSEETLAIELGMDVSVVRLGLEIFKRFGMIAFVNDLLCLPSWEEYQSVEKMNTVREKTRQRVAKYRERQKNAANNKKLLNSATNNSNLEPCNVTCNVTQALPVTQCNAIDKEIDIRDLDQDIKIGGGNNITKNIKSAEPILSDLSDLVGTPPPPPPVPYSPAPVDQDVMSLFSAWDRASGKVMSQAVADELLDLLKDYGIHTMLEAIKQCVQQDVVKLAYLKAVLRGGVNTRPRSSERKNSQLTALDDMQMLHQMFEENDE